MTRPRPFDDPETLAWLEHLRAASSPIETIEAALRAATECAPGKRLDAAAGNAALAAAELVAALAGETGAELPERVRAWADAQSLDIGALIPLARDAVARIGGESSELAERRATAGDEAWRDLLVQLERRLGTR